MTPERLEDLRALLRGGSRNQKLDAMEAAGRSGGLAASLVADLAALLTSTDYVPCTQREYEFSGHASLAWAAASAIESIGVAPEAEVLRRLLADEQLIVLPEASYDQGAYIGDYGSETLAPAGLAAKLVRLMGAGGFALFDALAANARHEQDLIADPARRTIIALTGTCASAPAESVERLWRELDELAARPDVAMPATHRGFALRDMVRDCVSKLEKSGVVR